MTQWEKRLAAMESHPIGHRYDEAVTILERFDFSMSSRSGSHCTWAHPSGARVTLVDKGHGTMKAPYIRKMLEQLKLHGIWPTLQG